MRGFKSIRAAWVLGVIVSGVVVGVAWAGTAWAGSERDIYPDPAQATADLKAALAHAAVEHKHVILDFGGNWCTDCQVLDLYFHDATNRPLLEANYILVHINVGHLTQNEDIAARYQIPLRKGVPALAVLDDKGALLYSQRTGEFESMRRMQTASVTEFLQHWRKTS
jgi:thiol:disulfide interchange protein